MEWNLRLNYLDRRMPDLWLRSLGSEKAMLLKQVAEERTKHEAENAELSRTRIEEDSRRDDAIAELKAEVVKLRDDNEEIN